MSIFTDNKICMDLVNPIDIIQKYWINPDITNIIYDSKMRKGQYDIIRQTSHDGTMIFTFQMFKRCLENIASGESYFKGTEPKDWDKIKRMKYIIGPIRHVTSYGYVQLRCSKTRKFPGQHEKITMPVICDYIYK